MGNYSLNGHKALLSSTRLALLGCCTTVLLCSQCCAGTQSNQKCNFEKKKYILEESVLFFKDLFQIGSFSSREQIAIKLESEWSA